jgi:hypothetical protein
MQMQAVVVTTMRSSIEEKVSKQRRKKKGFNQLFLMQENFVRR